MPNQIGLFFWDKRGVSELCSPFRQIVRSKVGSGAKWTFQKIEKKEKVSFDVHSAVRGVKERQEGLEDCATGIVLMGRLDKRTTTWM